MSDQTTVLVAMSDEQKLTYLCDQLSADAYRAVAAGSADEACGRARVHPPAVLVLGELAERHEQLRLLRAIRATGPQASGIDPWLGVIVVGADRGELAQLRAFEAGCDDYVPHDASSPLLRARLAALIARLRRVRRAPRRVGLLTVDPNSRTATHAGEPLGLTRMEFALLDCLASDPERVFTKHDLLRDVWGFRSEGRTRTVDAHACRLRKRLAAAGAVGFVVSVRGVGYRLTDIGLPGPQVRPGLTVVEGDHAA